ncbi:MAG: hypothetical protein MJ025_07305, partial [Victivallaceae bacterium]|nr:hypothetical protein [Victivallaceae bacterium]
FDSRTNLYHQDVDEITAFLTKKLYATKIPTNERLEEAPSFGLPNTKYSISCGFMPNSPSHSWLQFNLRLAFFHVKHTLQTPPAAMRPLAPATQ